MRVVTMEPKEAGDHNEELDFEAFINNSFIDVFYDDDFDVSLTNLFETDDLFFSKVDAMKSEFTAMCFLIVTLFVIIISCIYLISIQCKPNYLI